MPSGGASEQYRVRDLVVDVTGASVSRGGERIVLPPRTFELLVALVRRYPCTVRRHDLLDAVWPDEHVTDQTLSHRVMVLRKALGDHAEEPAYVAGERGFGYRLVAPVERLGPGEGEGAPAKERPAPTARGRKGLVLALGAASLVAIAAGGTWLALRHGEPAVARRAASAVPVRPPLDPAARAAHLERLCLRGEFFFLTFTREGLRRSAESWEQAVAFAPGHAPAHAGRAITGGIRALLDLVSPAEAERLARDGARRALELDTASPSAQLAGSLVRLLFDWDAAGAVAGARAASRREPEDPRGPIVLGLALLADDRLAEAERVLEAGALGDPHAAAVAYLEGRAHEMRARWTDAAAAYARALALEPDLAAARRGRAQSLTAAGQREAALAALIEAAPGADGALPGDLAGAWSRLCGNDPSAEAVRACVLAGRSERAERLLLAAVAARAPFVVFAPHDALLQPLRRGPAMRALVARLQQPPPLPAQP